MNAATATSGSDLAAVRAAGPAMQAVRWCAALPARAALGMIFIYQRTLSPALPVLTLGRCGCRFSPTCSHYAAEAIRTHGFLTGFVLGATRLVKCTPLHPGGFDPVPPRGARPVCRSA